MATTDTDTVTPELLVETDHGDVPALTTAELAVLFNTTPRKLRKLFRAAGVGVGRGSIYASTADDVQGIMDKLQRASIARG